MRFCTYCGKELKDGDSCTCSGAQEAKVTSTKQMSTKKPFKLIIPVAIALIILVTIICVVSNAKSTIDLKDYFVLDGVSGLNGQGTVSCHLDEYAMIEAMLGPKDSKELTEENWESVMAENFERYEEIGNALSCITLTVSPETGLSNGDVVTVRAVFENSRGYKFRHNFKDAEWTITVSGLEDAKTIDLFSDENISITFTGLSGTGKVEFEKLSHDAAFSAVSYTVSAPNHLSNGDTVTVTAILNANSLKNMGYLVPEITEKAYIVSGLGEYFDFPGEFPAGELQTLCNDALERTQALAGNEGGPVTSAPAVTGAYFLTTKTPNKTYLDIMAHLEFLNAVAIATEYTFELEGYGGLYYTRVNVIIYPDWYYASNQNLNFNTDMITIYNASANGSIEDMQAWFDFEFWSSLNVTELQIE